jgi:hypothetical protein
VKNQHHLEFFEFEFEFISRIQSGTRNRKRFLQRKVNNINEEFATV